MINTGAFFISFFFSVCANEQIKRTHYIFNNCFFFLFVPGKRITVWSRERFVCLFSSFVWFVYIISLMQSIQKIRRQNNNKSEKRGHNEHILNGRPGRFRDRLTHWEWICCWMAYTWTFLWPIQHRMVSLWHFQSWTFSNWRVHLLTLLHLHNIFNIT